MKGLLEKCVKNLLIQSNVIFYDIQVIKYSYYLNDYNNAEYVGGVFMHIYNETVNYLSNDNFL